MNTMYYEDENGTLVPTALRAALGEADEVEKSKAIDWLQAQGVTDDESAQAFIDGDDLVLKDGESFTEFAERFSDVLKSRGEALPDEKETEVNERLANILKTAAEEVEPEGDDTDDLLKAEEDEVMAQLLDGIGVQLKKAVDVGNAAVVCLIAERLPDVIDDIEKNSFDEDGEPYNIGLIQKARDVVDWFNTSVEKMVEDGILEIEKAAAPKPILASDGYDMTSTADQIALEDAAHLSVLTGDPQPIADEWSAQNAQRIAKVEDSIDADFVLESMAKDRARKRKISVEKAYDELLSKDADFKRMYALRSAKIARRDARAVAVQKDRNSVLNVIFKRLEAAARQAGVDPRDRDALIKFAEGEGREIYREYLEKGGKEIRRVTRRGGV